MSSSSTFDRRLLVGALEELLLWRVELGFCSANDGEGDGVDRWRGGPFLRQNFVAPAEEQSDLSPSFLSFRYL